MNIQVIRTALYIAGLTLASPAQSAELELPRDGWTSWEVEAVQGAPAMCCWSSWAAGHASSQACKLDESRGNFGSRDDQQTDAVRVYARLAAGKVERLKVLSASCPVKATTPIKDLGNIAADDSTRFLVTLSNDIGKGMSEDVRENVLAGLAMHRGDLAQNALASIARADSNDETRKNAIFWLAHVRGAAGAEVTLDLMFNDKDPEVRQHAAFAITQSRSPRVSADLIKLGTTDKDGKVRAQAWFWLAQSEAAESEAAILAAAKKDPDEEVREQAIFALSQLPDERATRALIAAAEDKALSSEQRKRAVFWLAESESKGAQTYLEQVLSGKAAN